VPNYTYPNTDTVKNKLLARSHVQLEKREAALVAARATEIRFGFGPEGRFDAAHLKAIHGHLFQDVYEWAGHTRDEQVRLSDGTVATEPFLSKPRGKAFALGPLIPDALDGIAAALREAGYLRGLSRDEFAARAADVMADLNAVHPFREGNGRTQRSFSTQLAKAAGHPLNFSIITRERMTQASIAAHEQGDPAMMRRLFGDIIDPERAAALHRAIGFLEEQGFPWNDHYIATVEPGYRIELTLAGIAGAHFMARTRSEILIGKTADLPTPPPGRGETFTLEPPAAVAERGQAS
jgi:cell filamentation protein